MALCPSRAVQEEEGCQLIVQPPFSLKGFLSSGTPFNSGSSPAMDSMYSFSSLPVLETCKEGRKETSRVGYGNKQSLQSCSNTHHLPLVLHLLLQLIQFHFQQFLLCHILSHSAL